MFYAPSLSLYILSSTDVSNNKGPPTSNIEQIMHHELPCFMQMIRLCQPGFDQRDCFCQNAVALESKMPFFIVKDEEIVDLWASSLKY